MYGRAELNDLRDRIGSRSVFGDDPDGHDAVLHSAPRRRRRGWILLRLNIDELAQQRRLGSERLLQDPDLVDLPGDLRVGALNPPIDEITRNCVVAAVRKVVSDRRIRGNAVDRSGDQAEVGIIEEPVSHQGDHVGAECGSRSRHGRALAVALRVRVPEEVFDVDRLRMRQRSRRIYIRVIALTAGYPVVTVRREEAHTVRWIGEPPRLLYRLDVRNAD